MRSLPALPCTKVGLLRSTRGSLRPPRRSFAMMSAADPTLTTKERSMESPPAPTLPATPHVHFTVPVPQIHAAFARVPDPRRRQGTRFPLPAILTLAVAAILANHCSLLAIAEWGSAQTDAIKRALGFPKGRTPHASPLQRLFRRLDPEALALAVSEVFDPQTPGEVPARGSEGVQGNSPPPPR